MPKFVFLIDQMTLIAEKPRTYQALSFTVEAPTSKEAFESIKGQIPQGHRMFCWYEDTPFALREG